MKITCPVCNLPMCWDIDNDFQDIGLEEKGIIHYYHCEKCGTEIEIYVPESAYETRCRG